MTRVIKGTDGRWYLCKEKQGGLEFKSTYNAGSDRIFISDGIIYVPKELRNKKVRIVVEQVKNE